MHILYMRLAARKDLGSRGERDLSTSPSRRRWRRWERQLRTSAAWVAFFALVSFYLPIVTAIQALLQARRRRPLPCLGGACEACTCLGRHAFFWQAAGHHRAGHPPAGHADDAQAALGAPWLAQRMARSAGQPAGSLCRQPAAGVGPVTPVARHCCAPRAAVSGQGWVRPGRARLG
jgi:hypothetical protein